MTECPGWRVSAGLLTRRWARRWRCCSCA